MASNANVYVGFGESYNSLIVKCVINFGTPTRGFRFSVNTAFAIDNIEADTDSEWAITKEWQPQWQYKSKEIEVSAKTPMQKYTR